MKQETGEERPDKSKNRKSKPVKQKASSEVVIQKILVAAVCVWMLIAVVMPLLKVVERAVNAEVPVAIIGEDEIRAAGRQVVIKDNTVLIDGEEAPLEGGAARGDGITVQLTSGGVRVTVDTISVQGRIISVPPVVAEVDNGDYFIDGERLPRTDWQRNAGRFIGFTNFKAYFSSRALYSSITNSIFVSFCTTLISVFLAFLYAYGLTRTNMPGKSLFRVIAMLPLFAPTMLYGLSLVYLFGNKGVITTGFFDALPWLATDIQLYGPVGIIISEVIFTFPPAMMILMVALSNTDARLYDAAASLGLGRLRTFLSVTLPGIKYGLISAVFVCFTLAFTDFGAPKVVGGGYSVLAVDIYKQVIGQQNFGMGATVSIILLIPTMLSFTADRIIQRRQSAAMSARSVPLDPKPNMPVDMLMFGVTSFIASFLLVMLFMAGYASLVKMWPYDFSLGLWHYNFEEVGGGGYEAFWNSMRMAGLTALIGTPLTFVSAYLIEKSKGMTQLRLAAYFLSILPLALPGLVIGIAYIFFFNSAQINIPFTDIGVKNIFNPLYGTMAILVISNIIHFYTVNFLTATTALRQLDREFESVAESMAVPFYVTFTRVTLPVCTPALLEIAMYYFVSSMATVSAVIFLYSPETILASVSVVNMDDAGDTTAAAAMCMLIVAANIAVRVVFELIGYLIKNKTQAWRKQ